MGTTPAPTALKVVRGDRPSRVNRDEPKPKPGACPAAPSTLSPRARAIWKRLGPQIHKAGLLTEWDVAAFATYCEAVIHHQDACKIVTELGVVVTDAKGHGVKNPALQVVRDTAQTIRAFAQEFGLTPSARSSITLQPQADDDEARRVLA